jgi:hypothetical protein
MNCRVQLNVLWFLFVHTVVNLYFRSTNIFLSALCSNALICTVPYSKKQSSIPYKITSKSTRSYIRFLYIKQGTGRHKLSTLHAVTFSHPRVTSYFLLDKYLRTLGLHQQKLTRTFCNTDTKWLPMNTAITLLRWPTVCVTSYAARNTTCSRTARPSLRHSNVTDLKCRLLRSTACTRVVLGGRWGWVSFMNSLEEKRKLHKCLGGDPWQTQAEFKKNISREFWEFRSGVAEDSVLMLRQWVNRIPTLTPGSDYPTDAA